ncbi:hypothetical protein HOO65_021041 [Ceratocystis lukuohia]|uniref:Uncharacterized protein n=1 Tax=Ceratocystis lukuohia TaxID=2019550 RepID=A0ABR4MQI0_9PEZI
MSDDPLFDIDGTERHDEYLLKKIQVPADITPSCATAKSINTDPTASLDDNDGNNNADNFNLWIPTPSLFNMQHVVTSYQRAFQLPASPQLFVPPKSLRNPKVVFERPQELLNRDPGRLLYCRPGHPLEIYPQIRKRHPGFEAADPNYCLGAALDIKCDDVYEPPPGSITTRRFTQGELIGIRHIIAYIDSLDWTFEATTLVLDTLLKHLPLPKYYNEFEPVRKYGWKIMNAGILTAADVSDMTTPEFLCMVAFSRLPSWNIMTVLVDDLPLADRLSTMLESA